MKLSEDRANTVMEYLLKKGIDKKRLSAKGFGLTMPIATNNTPEGRAQNRRVELKPVP
jgi:outer membrane protein OmpA-like peptidoglycan-associated protein